MGKLIPAKGPVGVELMTYRFVADAQTHCARLLGHNIGVKQFYKIILDFIIYFDRKFVTIWKCPVPP